MLPSELSAAQFSTYPPGARLVGVRYLALLQQLPLSFLPSLLRELITYDYAFPAERITMDRQLAAMAALTRQQLAAWLGGFFALKMTPDQEKADWVNQPGHFTEEFSAYLWATHQMDAFRVAAFAYSNHLDGVLTVVAPRAQRLGIAVIGKDVPSYSQPLFTNLRTHGTYFDRINPADGIARLLDTLSTRAAEPSESYAHWYVDGGIAAAHDPAITTISYASLGPVRAMLLKRIEEEVVKPGMGPEQLRTYLMRMTPADLQMSGDAVLDHFQIKLLTEGSGTQIFSTTFAQWAAREILRRAQPLSLMVRYTPRQRQRPMNEMLSSSPGDQQVDAVGSLVDGDMGAYYQWIDQQRLAGAQQSAFIVWFEDHSQAIAIGPSLPRGVESHSAVDLKALVALATG